MNIQSLGKITIAHKLIWQFVQNSFFYQNTESRKTVYLSMVIHLLENDVSIRKDSPVETRLAEKVHLAQRRRWNQTNKKGMPATREREDMRYAIYGGWYS